MRLDMSVLVGYLRTTRHRTAPLSNSNAAAAVSRSGLVGLRFSPNLPLTTRSSEIKSSWQLAVGSLFFDGVYVGPHVHLIPVCKRGLPVYIRVQSNPRLQIGSPRLHTGSRLAIPVYKQCHMGGGPPNESLPSEN